MTRNKNRVILLAVEHLKRWPTVRATRNETSEFAINFVQEEIFDQFGIPKEVVMDNGPAFPTDAFKGFLRLNEAQ